MRVVQILHRHLCAGRDVVTDHLQPPDLLASDVPARCPLLYKSVVEAFTHLLGNVSIFYDTGQGQGWQRVVPVTDRPHLPVLLAGARAGEWAFAAGEGLDPATLCIAGGAAARGGFGAGYAESGEEADPLHR